jgi:FtsP/CotA-like multicopper oxidase with cupredoxin domain
MSGRGFAGLMPAAALTLLGGAASVVAHDPADLEFVPKLDRFALTEAYRRGGEVERAGLEAELLPIPGADENAVQLVRDIDGDGDPDEIHFHLEVIEIQEEVYPGEFVTFWVFAPLGTAMTSPARLPSPTLRVEEGDIVEITLYNTHYLPHTLHLHGTSQDNNMDGVPHMTQEEVPPGKSFTYKFVAGKPGTFWYHCHVQDQIHPSMGLAGMFIIEPNRPHNNFAHLIPGAGRIASMSKASSIKVSIRSFTWTSTTASIESLRPTPIRARSKSGCIVTTT